MPGCTVGLCLDLVCEHLSPLKHLTLRLRDDCEAGNMQAFGSPDFHGLLSLTLSVPPGSSPFMFGTDDTLLDLSAFRDLQLLCLQGPIVKVNKGHPFILPPHSRVTIDPGLCGRKPTRWARQVASYEKRSLPHSAVPEEEEYQDEDYEIRKSRLREFGKLVIKEAIDMAGGPSVENIELKALASSELKAQGLRQYLDAEGLYYRSDLLSVDEDIVEIIAEKIFKQYFESDSGSEGGSERESSSSSDDDPRMIVLDTNGEMLACFEWATNQIVRVPAL